MNEICPVILAAGRERRLGLKHGDRSNRFPFIEAGHLARNLYLVCESQGLGCCTIGGFVDDKINELLDFSDTCEKTIYMAVIGRVNE